jgi:ABC-type uncharacterized transport system involved in gliding motility auxiliary subunit
MARRQWLLTAVATLGVAGSLVMGYLIVARQPWRLDLSPQRRYVLSDHARRILAALDRDVAVTAFLRADDPRNRDIADLLARVAGASGHVRYQLVDVNRSPAVARQYGVDTYGSMVVESDGERRDFTNPDEENLMAAIIQVTRPDRRPVYMLTGHGERSIRDRDRARGYTGAHVSLVRELYEVKELRLEGTSTVPADAAAVIVAGPRGDVSQAALQHLDQYVRGGGGLLVLLDPGDSPRLVSFLRRYGVVASDELVLDSGNRLFGGDYLTMLVPGRSPDHPVSAGLRSPPLFSAVGPVTMAATDLTESGIDVLHTSPSSWRTADSSALRTGVGEFVPGRDTRGPIPVGTSVLVRGRGGRSGRILVYGDSDFAGNLLLGYLGNRDLFLNSVNWLAGENTLVGSRPPGQIPGVNQFFISDRQGRVAFWLGTVIQPSIVLVLGVIVAVVRRRG